VLGTMAVIRDLERTKHLRRRIFVSAPGHMMIVDGAYSGIRNPSDHHAASPDHL
jgi:hypothetical protein